MSSRTSKPEMVGYAGHPSAQEAGARGPEFMLSLRYTLSICLKKKKKGLLLRTFLKIPVSQ